MNATAKSASLCFDHADGQEYAVTLQPKQIFHAPHAPEISISCLQGSLWITLYGEQRDVVLQAGERLTTRNTRQTIVYALEASRLAVAVDSGEAVRPRAFTSLGLLPQPAPIGRLMAARY